MIDNGIACCYWSASFSNQLRALKAHSSFLKYYGKNWPNYMYWIMENIVILESGYRPFYFSYLFLDIFVIRGGGCHWQRTAPGRESDIGSAKKSHQLHSFCWNLSGRIEDVFMPYTSLANLFEKWLSNADICIRVWTKVCVFVRFWRREWKALITQDY